jgi:hypothetical protein
MNRLQAIETIRFGEFLYAQELLTDAQLLEALAHHWSNGGRIGHSIKKHGFLTTEQIEQQAALYHGLDVVEIEA